MDCNNICLNIVLNILLKDKLSQRYKRITAHIAGYKILDQFQVAQVFIFLFDTWKEIVNLYQLYCLILISTLEFFGHFWTSRRNYLDILILNIQNFKISGFWLAGYWINSRWLKISYILQLTSFHYYYWSCLYFILKFIK